MFDNTQFWTVSDFRKCMADIMEEIQESNAIVILTHYGKPVAKIVPFNNAAEK
jgi:antitoxin (DNA-binding transcriptional repressor) of toxin-antitoxin stability system